MLLSIRCQSIDLDLEKSLLKASSLNNVDESCGALWWWSTGSITALFPMANIYRVYAGCMQTERRCLPFNSHYSEGTMLKASLKWLHEVNPKCLL